MAIWKPSPSSPTRLAAGTGTSWKISSPVLPARTPSLPWIVPVLKPSIAALQDKGAQAVVLLALVGAGDDQEMVGHVGQRDPDLGCR